METEKQDVNCGYSSTITDGIYNDNFSQDKHAHIQRFARYRQHDKTAQ